jgi:hypothetical protein
MDPIFKWANGVFSAAHGDLHAGRVLDLFYSSSCFHRLVLGSREYRPADGSKHSTAPLFQGLLSYHDVLPGQPRSFMVSFLAE